MDKAILPLTLYLIGIILLIISFNIPTGVKYNPVIILEIRDTADLIDGEIKYKAKIKYIETREVEILYLSEHYKSGDTINLLTNKNK